MNELNVRFQRRTPNDFFSTLRQRVDAYFQENKLQKQGNIHLNIKTVFMFALYLTPYFLILLQPMPIWATIIAAIFMGFGIAGIGLSVMHDANHGAYSKHVWLNNLMSYSMNFIGGSSTCWQIQHNVLHHTYTNIHELDEDLSSGRIIRFDKHTEVKSHHRYQHIYALFLYGLLTLVWTVQSDYKRLARYIQRGLLVQMKTTATKEWIILIFSKIFYLFYALVLPIWVGGVLWWVWVLCFLLMHYIAGFVLSTIFQLAHVMEYNLQPLPDKEGNMENEWAVHQLLTTANFGNNNKFLTWYAGGLNFQIEHHLFPNISHVHYPQIAKIVRNTATEFNLPYHSQPSYFKALIEHLKFLKLMGQTSLS